MQHQSKHDGTDKHLHHWRDWCVSFRVTTGNPQAHFFFFSETGYIGGAILSRLLSRKDRATFQITALLRDEHKARKLEEQFGVKAVVGSTADTDKVSSLAAAADIVFDTVSGQFISA